MIKKNMISPDLKDLMRFRKIKTAEIYGFFPIDRGECACKQEIKRVRDDLAKMPPEKVKAKIEEMRFVVCPRGKKGMRRYKIICNNCKALQGYLWATDKTIIDWCDFHYVQKSDGEEWRGCMIPSISPISEQLLFECSCGNDTRDFRGDLTLGGLAVKKEKENRIGRDLGQANSKFKAVSVNVFKFPSYKIWLR